MATDYGRYQYIKIEKDHGLITLTLNRPDSLNAIVPPMHHELETIWVDVSEDPEVNAILLTGAGRAFCAGGDVEFMRELQQRRDVETFSKMLRAGGEVVLQIVQMPKPVIASINGVAAGAGCNLALACDYRIASEQAKLGETFVRIGLHPDWGGTWLLPRIVGRSRALELMMTGRMVDASEALSIGMVDRVTADLAPETQKLARTLAEAPAAVLADIKQALNATEDLRAQLEVEAANQLRAFQSRESAERINAFFEKRWR
jgi:2-(1,2-epoxy-1,2-dihydrophenyl)acetyl-CoA isomerase